MPDLKKNTFFTSNLLSWFDRTAPRYLPWKEDQNPYFIWLSEIILQQTRVEQGMPYFLNFRATFPTVKDLAEAPLDEILKMWQGLGYYTRARNLHQSAQMIVRDFDGHFPVNYEDILSLKGIGPYTAAAICSFAYNLPYAVVDGNVFRVLSRFFGVKTAIDSSAGKKEFNALAQLLISPKRPGDYNQAIMDFGATLCTHNNPQCNNCPIRSQCFAHIKSMVTQLPIKEKKIKRKHRFFQYLVLEAKGKVYLEKRVKKDIWHGLYQFPMIETRKDFLAPGFLKGKSQWEIVSRAELILQLRQTLTHQEIHASFWKIEIPDKKHVSLPYTAVDIQNIHKFAVPKIIDLFLSETKGIFVKK